MIVLDSSAAVDLVLRYEAEASWVAEQLTAGGQIHAPHVLDAEVTSAVRRAYLARELTGDQGRETLARFADLRITRYPQTAFLERAWELRDNLTAADAIFVALAEALDAPLLTTDLRLAAAPGLRASIVAPDF